jgi:hypothetical protein
MGFDLQEWWIIGDNGDIYICGYVTSNNRVIMGRYGYDMDMMCIYIYIHNTHVYKYIYISTHHTMYVQWDI